MTLRNRLLRTFIPLLVLPLLVIIVVQLFLTRNYLIAAQRDLLLLETSVLRDTFLREYDQNVALQISTVPFFQNRLLESLHERFYPDGNLSRGFLVVNSDGSLRRPEIIEGSSRLPPDLFNDILSNLEEDSFILPDGIGGQRTRSMIVSAFYHEPSEWLFVVFNDLSPILAPLASSGIITSLVGLAGSLLAVFAVASASRRIAEPIADLTRSVSLFGEGETGQRSEITEGGEVGILSGEFNTMADRLESFTQDLEGKIEERTGELQKRMEELKLAQSQLIESEKMAALGGLVAGFAHEINTPIGVSITAVSYINDAITEAVRGVNDAALKKSELLKILDQAKAAATLGAANLNRAGDMVINFKQIAADQYFEEKSSIDLLQFLREIEDTLVTILKPARGRVGIYVPRDIKIMTYRGVLWQLLSNLTRNSLHHAFTENPSNDPGKPNRIELHAVTRDGILELYFLDNGPGIAEEHVRKIFEPFYTTRRNRGNTGLGLHIVYNLTSQKLGGQFSYVGTEERPVLAGEVPRDIGACFCIQLPIRSADPDLSNAGA